MRYTDNHLEREASRTSLTPEEVASAFDIAILTVTENTPTAEMLCCLVAQSAHETANWKSMWNFNFGNKKCKYDVTHTYLRGVYEYDSKGVKTIYNPIDVKGRTPSKAELEQLNQCRFRAYYDESEAAEELIEFFAIDTTPNNGKPNRYADAWACVEAGDLAGFVHELREAGYFTADEQSYLKACQAHYEKYLPICREICGSNIDVRLDRLEEWARGLGFKR